MTNAGHILVSVESSPRLRRAAADLQRYLALATGAYLPIAASAMPGADGVRFAVGHAGDGGLGDALIAGGVAPGDAPEGFAIKREGDLVAIVGADEAGAVYGVYGLLEEAYGCGFFLGSEVVPSGSMSLLPDALDVQRAPQFPTRGLLPWYDFLSGPTAWNLPEYRLYIDRMVRMGLNFLGLHVYSTGPVNRSGGAEPFLSFSYRGIGHDGYLDTTQTARWGYQPMRTSEFVYGTGEVFAGEVFGAEVAIAAQGPLDAAARAKAMLGEALDYAKERGLSVCVGFEPAAVPQEILEAIPANAKRRLRGRDGAPKDALDLTSVVARDILAIRLDDLLETYPQVDAIWLWQNEDAAWASHRAEMDTLPFDASYLQAARDYLKERAPDVQLVVSGWGAVHSLFDQLHAELSPDIAFSALNHNLGTSGTDEVYGRLDGRSRWPIPWLEDDATLWEPQYHVERFRNDIERAYRFGADGMIGIHWRTRVIDHVASYFARALWQPGLDTNAFYQWYSARLAGPERAEELASRLAEVDRTHGWPGYMDDSHVGSQAWSLGHSNEALFAFNPLPTPDPVVESFGAFTEFLAGLAETLEPAAAERLRYHASQAGFARHYVTSQHAALVVDELVAIAGAEQRTLTDVETAQASAQLVVIYEAVRAAIEAFAAELSTTADLGVLASLSLKYAQRAIWQRLDAVRQVVAEPGSLPQPDLTSCRVVNRVFVPVPPELVEPGGSFIEAIVQALEVTSVTVKVQPIDGGECSEVALARQGRGVWAGTLDAASTSRYWIEAHLANGDVVRSPEAPDCTYSAVVVKHG